MPVDFAWDNDEHSIIRLDIHDEATWSEYHAAIDQCVQAIEAGPNRVDVIFHEITGMPKGNPMPHLKVSFDKLTPLGNFGIGVVVSEKGVPPKIIKTFMEIAMRVYRLDQSRQGGFFGSLDAAREHIAQVRVVHSQDVG